MGWGGGTRIFDTVVQELSKLSLEKTGEKFNAEYMKPLVKLLDVLEDHDWDNACESTYYRNKVVGKILKRK